MRESRLNLSVVIFAGLLLFIICETAISLGIVLTVTAPVRWLLVPTSTSTTTQCLLVTACWLEILYSYRK